MKINRVLANPKTGIRGLARYLSAGYDLILLCQCAAYETCHRKVIIEHLKEVMKSIVVIMPEQYVQTDRKGKP